MNRDHIQRSIRAAMEAAGTDTLPGDVPADDIQIGVPESFITTCVDVTAYLDRKRASMRAHASQISEQSFFLAMPDEAFSTAFGMEWFVRRGATPTQPWEDRII